jgi:hypothetical protein
MNNEEFKRKMDLLQAALKKMEEERKRLETVPLNEKIATFQDSEPGGPPWTAVYSGRDNPFDGDPIGLGYTEAEAIADLKSQVQ